jgi:hypothetical protein
MGDGEEPLSPNADSIHSTLRLLAQGPKILLQGFWAALLPSPERERFARPRELDAPRWSLELGVVQMFAGAALFMMGGLAFMRPATAEGSMTLLGNWWPGLSTTHFQGLAMLNWFAWFIHPSSWPFAYLAIVGLGRCVAFAITREAVGEPVVWAVLRAWQRGVERVALRKREARLGPLRPDRIVTGRDGNLTVLSCREKPDWTDVATIEIADRFYRLAGVEDRSDGKWDVLAYRLREVEIGAGVIRRLVRYRPPPGASAPGPRAGI